MTHQEVLLGAQCVAEWQQGSGPVSHTTNQHRLSYALILSFSILFYLMRVLTSSQRNSGLGPADWAGGGGEFSPALH